MPSSRLRFRCLPGGSGSGMTPGAADECGIVGGWGGPGHPRPPSTRGKPTGPVAGRRQTVMTSQARARARPCYRLMRPRTSVLSQRQYGCSSVNVTYPLGLRRNVTRPPRLRCRTTIVMAIIARMTGGIAADGCRAIATGTLTLAVVEEAAT